MLEIPRSSTAKLPFPTGFTEISVDSIQDNPDIPEPNNGTDFLPDPEDDSNLLHMLEAYSAANSIQKGKSYLILFRLFSFTDFQCSRKTQRN